MKWKVTTSVVLLGLSLLSTPVRAQQKKPGGNPTKTTVAKPALAVINNPAPSYQSGEVNVTVRGDENPIIRLLMAPSGQALVEFPAKDRIFKVNPADPELVTIEDSPTKESDRYILLRSSRQFLPNAAGAPGSPASTSMIVQMTSGMVITLLVYPARELEQAVHRCVVRYDRDAIISARQAAGLAVNLDRREDEVAAKTAPTSLQYASLLKLNFDPQLAVGAGQVVAPPAPSAAPATEKESVKAKTPTVFAEPQVRATEVKVKKGGKEPLDPWKGWSGGLKWSKPFHGLKTAAQQRAVNGSERQTLVTLRNTLSTPIKIVSGQPELTVQTLDERGRVLQVEPVKLTKVETEEPDSLIAPGETRRYLLTYEAPVLGAKQRLCVAVAQINAADEPAMVELTAGTR